MSDICKHIQFTKEIEFKSSLPFLDVLVSRSGNNISTQIHKKPTHTDRYLPYTSHHPKHQKLATTHSLYNRISSHITDQTERQIARREVRQTLRTNGYPCKYTYPPNPDHNVNYLRSPNSHHFHTFKELQKRLREV